MPKYVYSFSLVAGGPCYRLLRSLGIVRPGDFEPVRPAIVFALATWLPLMLIGLSERLRGRALDPILTDVAVHVRLLLALPLLLAAERALEFHCSLAVDRFTRGRFVGPDDLDAFASVVAHTVRLRDRSGPELALLVLALTGGLAALGGVSVTSIASVSGQVRDIPAEVWYALVALPVFQFLLLRWLWRWTMWSWMLFRVSRLRLRLMPLHPDHAGGLLHLSNPIAALAMVVVGASSVLSASWSMQIVHGHAQVLDFVPSLVLFALLVELLALAPVLPFAPALRRARFTGITEYALFALRVTRAFARRWTRHERADNLILGGSDVSVLTDLMSSYEVLTQMGLVPFNRGMALVIALAVIVPMLPLATTVVPLPQLLTQLARALLT